MFDKMRPFADLMVGLLLVLAFDVLAFHHGFYFGLLRPDSYSGRVEETWRRFAALRAKSPLRQVVVMSNSTGGSCVTEAELEQVLQEEGWPLAAANLSSGGTSARAWYYLLGNKQISRETTALVVLGVHPQGLAPTESTTDLQIIKTRLVLANLVSLPASLSTTEQRLKAASAVLFRTPLFREDLLDLLEDPQARLDAVAKASKSEGRFGRGWRRAVLSQDDLTSARLAANGTLDLASVPERVKSNRELIHSLELLLRRRAEPSQAKSSILIAPEQGAMLQRTIRMLGRRGIPVVVAVTPESPFPVPGHGAAELEELVGSLRAEGFKVEFFQNKEMLDRVEVPLYFRDPYHVNALGAEIYTRSLASFLSGLFAGSELEIEERRGIPRRQQDQKPEEAGDEQDS